MKFVYAGDKEVKLSPINLDISSEAFKYKMGDSIDLSKERGCPTCKPAPDG